MKLQKDQEVQKTLYSSQQKEKKNKTNKHISNRNFRVTI